MRALPGGGPVRVTRLRARNGIITRQTQQQVTWTYTARSENDTPTTLVIEHRSRPTWKIDAGQNPIESTPDADRFRLTVPAHQEASLAVRESQTVTAAVDVGDITGDWVRDIVTGGLPATDVERALQPVIDTQTALSAKQSALASLEVERDRIGDDQERLRENLKALKGSSEERALVQRYTRQLDAQEDRLDALHTAIAQTTRECDTLSRELTAAIAALSFDITAPAQR